MVSGGKKKKCYYCIKMLQIASTLWHLLLLQNIWKFTYFPFFPPFLVCLHWRLQLSTSNLCMLNTGPGLCFKLFVMSQIVLGDPPLEIKMQWALNFFFFFALTALTRRQTHFCLQGGFKVKILEAQIFLTLKQENNYLLELPTSQRHLKCDPDYCFICEI